MYTNNLIIILAKLNIISLKKEYLINKTFKQNIY